jgi:hypothetical protein
MPEDTRISEFLEKAQAAGIPHESQVGLLTAQGWREKDVYRALGEHYRKAIGIEIPPRFGAGASAKEAFFYLLIFATLATWTYQLGSLAFTLIDRWLADPLFSNYPETYTTYAVTWSLAALIVAFPLFLLLSRAVLREAADDPARLDSAVRKWLTYLALVIAASVFMGDLIAALAYLLRGELTSRFLAKSCVVLAISGGVFFYYFGGMRGTATRPDVTPVTSGRDRLMAALSAAVVAVMLVLGFLQLGAPRTQRDLRADARRVNELYRLSTEIQGYWNAHASTLPPSLDELSGSPHQDPISQSQYEYRPGQGSKYELCASFTHETPDQGADSGVSPWKHSSGHSCFPLDATMPTQYPAQPME